MAGGDRCEWGESARGRPAGYPRGGVVAHEAAEDAVHGPRRSQSATWRNQLFFARAHTGQAKNWIYPKIGDTELRDFNATDAERFFKQLAGVLPAVLDVPPDRARNGTTFIPPASVGTL
jgi:hypothetical protein